VIAIRCRPMARKAPLAFAPALTRQRRSSTTPRGDLGANARVVVLADVGRPLFIAERQGRSKVRLCDAADITQVDTPRFARTTLGASGASGSVIVHVRIRPGL
jgi:hypothetical protein